MVSPHRSQHHRIAGPGERFLRQAHRSRGHRDRVGADPGIGTRALGGGEGVLKQAIQRAAEGAGIARAGPGLLHLAEDLRFAQHHRIEASGHPEQVPHGVAIAMPVQIGMQVVAAVRMDGQPFGQRLAIVVGLCIQLGAVAGGEQDRLVHLRQRAQRCQRGSQRIRGERHLLAQGDRRGLVVDAEDVQAHAVLSGSVRCLR